MQDLISELKTGLGLQWELLIKELLEDRGFADALAVFDAMCVSIGLGPVVQSIVSLTKSLVNDLLSLLVRLKSSVLIFFAEKM